MAEQRGQFDAAGFFNSEGMTFKGLDEKGQAKVVLSDGQEGLLDLHGMLKADGVDPSTVDINYNDINQPINETPQDFNWDRLKMSFGNRKGNIGYLKSRFQDAGVTDTGDVVVKDKGIWKRTDLDGLGGDDGWTVSELMGDLADVGGDIAVGTGAALGTVATGGAGAAIASAAASTGAASAIKNNILGRVMGTYDATPMEAAKDIALDAIIGAAGEGVALGAKNYVLPAIKNGLKKIGGLEETSQSLLANVLSGLDDQGPDAYRHLFAHGDDATKLAAEYQEKAMKEATLKGASDISKGALPESFQSAYQRVAEEAQVEAAMPFVKNAQGNLSKHFGDQLDDIIETQLKNPKEIQAALSENATHIQNGVSQFLNETGLMDMLQPTARELKAASRGASSALKETENGFIRRRFNPDQIVDFFNKFDSAIDRNQGAEIAKSLNNALSIVDGLPTMKVTSPAEVKKVLEITKTLGQISDSLPMRLTEMLKTRGFQSLNNMDTAISNALPSGFRDSYSALRGSYRELKSVVNEIAGPAYRANNPETYKQIGRRFNEALRLANNGDGRGRDILNMFMKFTPNAEMAKNELYLRNSARLLAGFRSTEAHTASAVKARAITRMAHKAVMPVVVRMSDLQRRASLKTMLSSQPYGMLRTSANLIKQGGEKLLNDPAKLGAAVSAMMNANNFLRDYK